MSMNVSQYGAAGVNLILNSGIKQIESEQADIAWQTSQGTTSSSIAGLGSDQQTILSLSPKLAELNGYQDNISSVQNRLSLSSTALKQVTDLAQSLNTQLLGMLSSEGSTSTATSTAADSARTGLGSLGTILNTSDGNGFIFAGQNTSTAPVTSPSTLSSSTLARTISGLVSGLNGSNSNEIFNQATTASADNSAGMSVFSQALSQPADQAGRLQSSAITGPDGSSTQTGPVATEGGQASSTSTGSPIRDLMRDMMIMTSMKGMDATTPGFTSLVRQLHDSLGTTTNQLIDMNTSVGVTQNTLTRQQGIYSSLQLMVKEQLSNGLNVNLAEVASRSSDLSIQLKASFSLIADTKNMSLADYL
ncbi:flagellar biosynthesis protein FlgL [Acetobacteraceae bacterium B3987]|nr:flagellar biosynthesis protein FlgL [Acetobacteraceae bacterium B3987]